MKYTLLGSSKSGQRVDIGTAKMDNARQASTYMVALGFACVFVSQVVETHHSDGRVTNPGEEPDELVCGRDLVDHPQLGLIPPDVSMEQHLINASIIGTSNYRDLPTYNVEDDTNEVCFLRVTNHSGAESQLGNTANLEKAREVVKHFLEKEEQIASITIDRFVEYHYDGGVETVFPEA